MNPKAEMFFDAVTLLPEDVTEEAQYYRFRKRESGWKKMGTLAACLTLTVSLALLAVVPRGCGADGGSAGAPEQGERSGEPAPADSPAGIPDANYVGAEPSQLTAEVVEIYEDAILVESGGERTVVSTAGLELPELAAGDTVRVTFSGGPAAAPEARSIEKIGE